jgi:hypothetical protein
MDELGSPSEREATERATRRENVESEPGAAKRA